MASRFELSIIIPAWNEEGRLEKSLLALTGWLSTAPFRTEVIVVVEESSDTTLAIAQRFSQPGSAFKVIAKKHEGKGSAVKHGVLASQGEIVLFMDADLATSLDEVLRFTSIMRRDPNLAMLIGSRVEGRGSQARVKRELWRGLMTRIFSKVVLSWILRMPFKDSQCGFKAFRRKAALELFEMLETPHYGFDLDILLLAQQRELIIASLPVQWTAVAGSHVRVFRDGWVLLSHAWGLEKRISALMSRRSSDRTDRKQAA